MKEPELFLSSRAAVVTGAGRGLGRETAVALAARGALVILVSRSVAELEVTAGMIRDRGGRAEVVAADVRVPEGAGAVRACAVRLGRTVSILVNAAGVFGPIQKVQESDAGRWIDTIAVNVVGPYLMCREFVGDMLGAGWGRIINFTSAASLHPPGPLNSAYGTSKVALNQFTRHLAAELDGTGVTANVLHPGDVKTEMWAAIRREAEGLGPEAEGYRKWVAWVDETGGDPPGKAAALVVRLTREESAGVSGRFLWIDGGLQAPLPSWGEAEGVQPWR